MSQQLGLRFSEAAGKNRLWCARCHGFFDGPRKDHDAKHTCGQRNIP